MNQNSLLEFGSKVDVVIRFKTEKTINGKTYTANEPYLYLKDAQAVINYSGEDKTSSTNKTILANSNIAPRSVSIGGFSFSRKIIALLSQFETENYSYDKTRFESVVVEDNELYLDPNLVVNENKPMFVYDEDFNKIDFEFDGETNLITGAALENSKEYLVVYSSVELGPKFNLNNDFHVPYMSLEIQGKGNIDKEEKDMIMYFDKVSLVSMLEFNFIQDQIINVPLEFHIIDTNINYLTFNGE